MNEKLEIGSWEELKEEAQAVRYQVFVIEQNVPVELEWDARDPECLHAVVRDEAGRPVATGRLLPDAHIGRMAVLRHMRGKGTGAAVLEALMTRARARGDKSVELSAQTHAEAFYQRFGFVREGEEFMEAGIPHVHMRYVFPA